jgi:ABC-type multidrug transport system fused ATPase/permease subunit
MQDIIDSEFSTKTVVAVVHRLRFIDRYDRVALMKYGELVECDSPQALLNKNSEFKRLHDAMRMNRLKY